MVRCFENRRELEKFVRSVCGKNNGLGNDNLGPGCILIDTENLDQAEKDQEQYSRLKEHVEGCMMSCLPGYIDMLRKEAEENEELKRMLKEVSAFRLGFQEAVQLRTEILYKAFQRADADYLGILQNGGAAQNRR